MKDSPRISIETLHLIAGFSLIVSGILAYFVEGIGMALSWGIFGAMYISMSDIGEDDMSDTKRRHLKHRNRRAFGYLGASLSIFLIILYLKDLLAS